MAAPRPAFPNGACKMEYITMTGHNIGVLAGKDDSGGAGMKLGNNLEQHLELSNFSGSQNQVAVMAGQGARIIIADSTLNDNVYGLVVRGGAVVEARNCSLTGNTHYGAVVQSGGTLYLSGCTVNNNMAGSILVDAGGHLVVLDDAGSVLLPAPVVAGAPPPPPPPPPPPVACACTWSECGMSEPFPKAFKVCGKCRTAKYCCAEHARLDWRRHKNSDECRV